MVNVFLAFHYSSTAIGWIKIYTFIFASSKWTANQSSLFELHQQSYQRASQQFWIFSRGYREHLKCMSWTGIFKWVKQTDLTTFEEKILKSFWSILACLLIEHWFAFLRINSKLLQIFHFARATSHPSAFLSSSCLVFLEPFIIFTYNICDLHTLLHQCQFRSIWYEYRVKKEIIMYNNIVFIPHKPQMLNFYSSLHAATLLRIKRCWEQSKNTVNWVFAFGVQFAVAPVLCIYILWLANKDP